MNEIRLQQTHRSLASPAKPGGSAYIPYMFCFERGSSREAAPRVSFVLLEACSFHNGKGLFSGLLSQK